MVWIDKNENGMIEPENRMIDPMKNSDAEPEPVLFGRSRSKGPAPAPGSGSTIDKTNKILNDILFVSFHIDKRLVKK